MADNYGKGKNRRKGGKKGEAREDYDAYGKGYGANNSSMGGGAGGKASKDVVHHYPPKEMAADVGYPVRGGQTLLIAYFPWEASEADIEREFSKFCRVKRVHLVVDKSSRKPRCFGFVKFLSKADAEEALRATTQGLVQLPDTRGHVWHLKAEWTKSGDMVVDDSEAEQEVAKRKEERRSRTDTTTAPGTATRELLSLGSQERSIQEFLPRYLLYRHAVLRRPAEGLLALREEIRLPVIRPEHHEIDTPRRGLAESEPSEPVPKMVRRPENHRIATPRPSIESGNSPRRENSSFRFLRPENLPTQTPRTSDASRARRLSLASWRGWQEEGKCTKQRKVCALLVVLLVVAIAVFLILMTRQAGKTCASTKQLADLCPLSRTIRELCPLVTALLYR
ncbi:unnamed protein product [Effrenium voratum]|nr:unnamed protein product [Effrenium voratum]